MATVHRYQIHGGRQNAEIWETNTLLYMRPAGEADIDPSAPNTNVGLVVLRDGWITGAVACINIADPFISGQLTAQVRVNDTVVFSASSPTLTGPGIVRWGATQATGIDAVSDGDKVTLSMFCNSGGGPISPTATPIVLCELSFP